MCLQVITCLVTRNPWLFFAERRVYSLEIFVFSSQKCVYSESIPLRHQRVVTRHKYLVCPEVNRYPPRNKCWLSKNTSLFSPKKTAQSFESRENSQISSTHVSLPSQKHINCNCLIAAIAWGCVQEFPFRFLWGHTRASVRTRLCELSLLLVLVREKRACVCRVFLVKHKPFYFQQDKIKKGRYIRDMVLFSWGERRVLLFHAER